MPEIILIGPPRCGTTSCFRWLAEHPEIAPSKRKELNYFTGFSVKKDNFSGASPDEYRAHMQKKPGASLTLEASPVYSHPQLIPQVYERIRTTLPDPRIMIMLRNPVDRFFSQYRVDKREGITGSLTLTDYFYRSCQFPEVGVRDGALAENIWLQIADYEAVLSGVLATFPAQRVIPIFMDWFKTAPDFCSTYLTEALGLVRPLDAAAIRADNRYYEPLNPALHRLASRVRLRVEPLLQRMPVARAHIYAAYKAMNESDSAAPARAAETAEIVALLKPYYAPRNAAARALLAQHFTLAHLPAWIEESG